MKAAPLLLALACVPAQHRAEVDPHALAGVTLGIPAPVDARETPGIGCGMLAGDLSLRAEKLLVNSFSDAGASVTNSDRAPFVLSLAIREAGMGLENALPRRSDPPVRQGEADAPPVDAPQASLFNSGNGNAEAVLDATLSRGGEVVWRETISGHARGAPCIQAYDRVREALSDAIDQIRAQVIPRVRR